MSYRQRRRSILLICCAVIFWMLGFYFSKFFHIELKVNEESQMKRLIYVVTPTYRRPEQYADLTRLAQTLALDGSIHWIVVEDASELSQRLASFLKRFEGYGIKTTHLFTETPSNERRAFNTSRYQMSRGSRQRNAALKWLREQTQDSAQNPVVYFADDDNSYDVRLFDEMRRLKQIGVWPVGLVAGLLYEGPVCDESHSRVVSWRSTAQKRFCPCDMAGFAVSLKLILKYDKVYFRPPLRGMQESDFLAQFFNVSRSLSSEARNEFFEPIACDEVLVWHTKTQRSRDITERKINMPLLLEV